MATQFDALVQFEPFGRAEFLEALEAAPPIADFPVLDAALAVVQARSQEHAIDLVAPVPEPMIDGALPTRDFEPALGRTEAHEVINMSKHPPGLVSSYHPRGSSQAMIELLLLIANISTRWPASRKKILSTGRKRAALRLLLIAPR
ncbi:hypothetical protein JJB99_07955 [Bradyrhizobium diazoefficiens]|uniref:hypothetical protein n=1 Tax=Bradyrhizobium diazoefficiens TaxID=1355477 RepID=UPI00190DBD3A|nr:hypothetical protein [Bradyrhizobium diazoefficiens]QQO16077.1 hypothetical protein JJB99_07955 [Bradyrhizobium diazoefficiens]